MILETPEKFQASCVAPSKTSWEALYFAFRGKEILVCVTETNGFRIPTFENIQDAKITTIQKHYIGVFKGIDCYAVETLETQEIPEMMQWVGLRVVFAKIDNSLFALAGRSYQIIDWDRTHKFCGQCGLETILSDDERVKICLKCQQKHYPRISPAVMALISRGHEFLLARSHHFPAGMFSALAGFSEPGETLEQTVHREVYEEVGIKVFNLRYFASQPWPFPHSMMIAFHCDYKSGEIECDETEIEAADWFSAKNLPPRLPGDISIARQLVNSKLEI